ncbi:STELAR K+ outward rectifier isoform 1 [Dorcoceras hygrometricum]|uniref:STELAR K+ outward rectifier isoform 1 n=1 Tax=Dorcoceras hygrometricum TaxID=472368 RepID=A0A2Z7AZB5_9LAMI|nr:STELAR K+ outward rectifier isoform 1 [Dorcoceras hygrometricum]
MSFKRKLSKTDGNIGGEGGRDGPIDGGDEEYVVEELRDRIRSSRHSRFTLMENALSAQPEFSSHSVIDDIKDISHGFFIQPDNRFLFSVHEAFNQ